MPQRQTRPHLAGLECQVPLQLQYPITPQYGSAWFRIPTLP